MSLSGKSPADCRQTWRELGLCALLLLVILGFLFRDGLLPDHTVFANDGPLGLLSSQWGRMPAAFHGVWQDSNWLGTPAGNAQPNINGLLLTLLSPLGYSKIFALFTIFFLGCSAWFCFKQWKFAPAVCVLGGLATALNSDFFANSCWGVGTQQICFGLNFIALGLLADESSSKRWIRVVLAGFAVGMGVSEGFDNGALFSLVVAAYVLYQSWTGEGAAAQKLVRGTSRLALVGAGAGFMAVSALSMLIGTQIKGIAGTEQDAETKRARWDYCTQWSLPKSEALGMIVPGLFGFRMDTPDGGAYWGKGGRDPHWDRYFGESPLQAGDIIATSVAGSRELSRAQQIDAKGNLTLPLVGEVKASGKYISDLSNEVAKLYAAKAPGKEVQLQMQPQGFIRYGGGGGYAGQLVIIIAIWTVLQSFRGASSVFALRQRKMIWFWCAVAVVSLLFAFGRFAPFYQFFYALPYVSTIRNPAKFMHVLEWALVILFAYGVQGLWQRCIVSAPPARDLVAQLQGWWAKVTGFDRRWVLGCLLVAGLFVVAWLAYSKQQTAIVQRLAQVHELEAAQRGENPDAAGAVALAKAQLNFSVGQVGKTIFILLPQLALVMVVLSGYFSGGRQRLAAILLGVALVADLGYANTPWVITYNWKEKYLEAGDNPVIAFLKQKPYEHRVAIADPFITPQYGLLSGVYGYDWKQLLFQYYNIQTIDIVQMPRVPKEVQAFEGALYFDRTTNTLHRIPRRWQLMNNRYLLGPLGLGEALNREFNSPGLFKDIMAFEFYQTRAGGPILTRTNSTGPFGLIDFTGALPRAKVYSNWQVSPNDDATLARMADKEFDPTQTVLVADPITPAASTNANSGSVEFKNYSPTRIELQAKATAPSVLLLNDKHDPDWHVTVDGKPARLLRCNYVMRGVQLEPGEHTVEFRYQPSLNALYVSVVALVLGLALIGYLAVPRNESPKG